MIPIPYPSPRVSQVDAHILDNELISLLKEQLSAVFQHHSNSKWSYNQHPELWTLILNLVIFRQTVWKNGSSYGLSLQNLKLTDLKSGKIIGKSKKSMLFLLLLGTYFFNKVQSYLYTVEEDNVSDQPRPKFIGAKVIRNLRDALFNNKALLLSKIDHTLKIVNLINFSLFLLNGKYPSITHRVLGISLTPVVTDLLKFNGNNVNFEFQNRQLVWNVMTEFLVFTLPLLQLGKLRKMAKKIINRRIRKSSQQQVSVGENVLTPYTNLPVSQCAICHDNNAKAASTGGKPSHVSTSVTNAFITNCGHIYCYVCIATRFNAIKTNGDDQNCLRCAKKLEWFKEYSDDVDEDAILFEGEEIEEEMAGFEEEENEEVTNEKGEVDISGSESDYSEGEDEYEDEAFDL